MNIDIKGSRYLIFALLIFTCSCTNRNEILSNDINHDSLNVFTSNKVYVNKCVGNEYIFNEYLFSKLDDKKYHYINPYFSNEIFSVYLEETSYKTNDNIIALDISGKTFEKLSIYLYQAYNIKRARSLFHKSFDKELYEKLNIDMDTISGQISKLYEIK